MSPIEVFLSVGRTSTPEQEQFVVDLEQYLRDNGLTPMTIGRSYFSSVAPMKAVQELMGRCCGTVILAFERIHISDGIERRGSEAQKSIANQDLPTVWNQIEAAMAYVLDHPLLVLVGDGIRSEGLLEKGYDWYVQEVPITPEVLHSRQFAGVFADWRHRVEKHSQDVQAIRAKKASDVDTSKLTLGQILTALRPAQFWGLLVAFAAVLSAVAATAFQLGTIAGRIP